MFDAYPHFVLGRFRYPFFEYDSEQRLALYLIPKQI